ncbi:MAG: hypothetical protein ACI9DC_002324 [Gammaproteobacteria bacterium]|jgi:hypothetical protein
MRELCGLPVYPVSTDSALAQRELDALDLGDGLPLVIPSEARIDAMLAGVNAAQQVHGMLPPLFGELRVDAVAYQCVLAGCEPTELGVVFAAAEACLDPEFNLLGLLTTTGTAAVALVVHGAIATTLDVSSSSNCLGPGARANACIGRALSLVLRNIAGAKPGVADMATMGQPGKFTFCFAERDDHDFPTLPERQDLARTANAVTVLGVSGTAEVLPIAGGGSVENILAPVALAMSASVLMGGAREREPTQQVVLLPPELIGTLAKQGFGLADIQSYLFDTANVCGLLNATAFQNVQPPGPIAASAADIHPIQTGGPGVKMTFLPLWAGGTRPTTRAVRNLRATA